MRNDVVMKTIATFPIWQQDLRNQSPLIPEGANSLQLDLVDGFTRELTMAKLGRFFVFGLAEDRLSWCLFRLSGVLALRFQAQFTDPAPAVTWTHKAAGELISSLSLPAPATIGFQKPPIKNVDLVLLGATKSLLATDNYRMPFIPLQTISYLEISNN